MVDEPSLIEVRELLVRALELADKAGDSFLGVLIETALQDAISKIDDVSG